MSVRVYITDRDKKVLRFVEQYGSITISQARRMFYSTQKYGYDIARKRLKKLVDYNKLKMVRDMTGNENVYYMDRKLSYHDLLVLDYYAELIYNGADIVYFKQMKPWMGGRCISDAYCCYVIGSKMFFNIVEVVRTHGIDKDKYLELYRSEEPQRVGSIIYEKLGGSPINEFPRLIIIDSVTHRKYENMHPDIRIHQLDFKLRKITEIFL